jgi:RNA polymerase sigma factor (sigma-70 family)
MDINRLFSDGELIANLRSGNRLNESVKAIYRDCFDMLSRYVINNNGSRQDAEDIFQEVVVRFIDLVQKNKFRGEASVKTFLFAMNKHSWLNELKRRGRAGKREMNYDKAQESVEMDAAHFIAGREAKNELMAIVTRLGEACKKILLMFYYDNLSMKEILDSTDFENEQVVRNKKYKCLKQLEQMMNHDPSLMNIFKNALHG